MSYEDTINIFSAGLKLKLNETVCTKKKHHKENLHKNISRPEIETFPIKHKSQEIYVNTGNSKKNLQISKKIFELF